MNREGKTVMGPLTIFIGLRWYKVIKNSCTRSKVIRKYIHMYAVKMINKRPLINYSLSSWFYISEGQAPPCRIKTPHWDIKGGL